MSRRAHAGWAGGLAAAGLAWYAADSLRHRREEGHGYALAGEVSVADPAFMRAAEALTASPITTGNRVELLVNGDAIFPRYLETIAGARRSLNITTYAYWRGQIARDVAEALAERARAGVEVNLLVDALGGARMERDLLDLMEDAGVCVHRFRPLKPYAVRRLENRTHRKLLIADGTVGMTGGVGIAEEWTGDAQDPDHWRDSHVRVEGPVVRGLQGAFAENWIEATGTVLGGEDYLPEIAPFDDGAPMQVTRSSAGVGDTNAEALTYLAIAAADRSLDLTSAYFVPRPAFLEALVDAAERGVRLRILVPGSHIDKGIVRTAGRSVYDQLLGAGAELYEYRPTMLHAKTLTVDGAWACVGSVNFDNRSFQLHDEASLSVQDAGFAAALTEQFERDVADSERIEPEAWKRRGARRRAAEAVSRLARREL